KRKTRRAGEASSPPLYIRRGLARLAPVGPSEGGGEADQQLLLEFPLRGELHDGDRGAAPFVDHVVRGEADETTAPVVEPSRPRRHAGGRDPRIAERRVVA